MKQYIYANYNRLGDFYCGMMFDQTNPDDMKVSYRQIVCNLDEKALSFLKECELYYLGEFDNVTGEIIAKKEFMLNCGDVIDQVLSVKGKVIEDEKC